MKTVRLTMATALVRFLENQFVERDGVERPLVHAFAGIFGHGNVSGLGQALEEESQRPFFQPKNEQAMVHMAVAFAKENDRLSTFACTTSVGPGATNLVTGAATATLDRLPVLLLPGDVFANRRPAPVLQQLEHPLSQDTSVNDCLRPVSRYWDRIQRPEQLLYALPEAVRILISPVETGAVTLCLPQDVQTEAFDYPQHFFVRRLHRVARPRCGSREIVSAAEWVQNSKRPILILGGGVHYAGATLELEKFADRTGIPVGLTQAGKGALLDAHPLCLGGIGVTGTAAANALACDADLVLAVGTRLSDFTTASKTLFQQPEVRFVNISIHPGDAHKHGGLPLVGDARAVLEDLAAALAGYQTDAGYRSAIATARSDWETTRRHIVRPERAAGSPLVQAEVIGLLNEELDAGCTIVHAAGGLPGDLHKLWRSRAQRDYHSEYGYSCMGYEIAGALGVKAARPEREVFALVGDGSYLMLHTEIVTAVQEGWKIVIVLLDNSGYQCIHGLQRACGGRSFGNEFRQRDGARLTGRPLRIDFAANARSLGAEAFLASTAEELRAALRAARAASRTALVHVPLEAQPIPGTAWWDVPVAEISNRPETQAARQQYDTARAKQRYYFAGEPEETT